MKLKLSSYQPQYIVDHTGKRKSVIFEIQNFEKLIEEVEDMYFGALADKEFKKDQTTMTHADHSS